MFSRSKKEPAKKRNHDLSQFGLFDVPKSLDDGISDDDGGGDSDLEAELAAITAGGGSSRNRSRPKAKPQIAAVDLDRMVAESMKDVDDDSDVDENDPDLLNELSEITETEAPPSPHSVATPAEEPADTFVPTSSVDVAELLRQRISMYVQAEANAKTANDSSKARRIGRGLKTLEGLLKQAKAGRPVNVDDIPPEVTVKVSSAPVPVPNVSDELPAIPMRAAPPPPPPQAPVPQSPVSSVAEPMEIDSTVKVDEKLVATLLARQREYRVAALTAKKSGNNEAALGFVKIAKMFEAVIQAAQKGQPVDISDMPPSPGDNNLPVTVASSAVVQPMREEAESQNRSEDPSQLAAAEASEAGLVTGETVLEALVQRLDKYKAVEQAAKDEDNSSKARRFGRIVKQYEDAIKKHKAGKAVPFDELPTPPGFGPIPGVAPPPPVETAADVPPVPARRIPPPAVPAVVAAPTPGPARPTLQKQDTLTRLSGNHSNTTAMMKNVTVIQERQLEYRRAAVEAKKNGDLEQARAFLKIFKALEQLLDVAKGGMPVDLSTLPISPSQRATLEDSFTIINDTDCSSDGLGDITLRLEEQLQSQLIMCKTTRDHHKAMGDVAGTNRFENLALVVQKDYDLVKVIRKKNLAVPKFHYEKKSFNIVRCNTDLTDNELEINVIRGISYSVANPKDVDTYVKVEFPYPADMPFQAKTKLIKDTDSPEYNDKFIAEINPKNTKCQRVFKRHAIKLEVYSKGGFLRSDTLIGTASVKVQPLETVCEIHDSFDLMDGRKTTGGKLEVKIRIKNPILTKQVQHTEEKWLVIDASPS